MGQVISYWKYGRCVELPAYSQLYKDRVGSEMGVGDERGVAMVGRLARVGGAGTGSVGYENRGCCNNGYRKKTPSSDIEHYCCYCHRDTK